MEQSNNIKLTEEPPNLKKPMLDLDAFYGSVDHKDILNQLLSQIQPVDFRDVIKFTDDKLKQKHKLFAIVKYLLLTAKNHNWNLCKRFDYTYVYNGAFWKQCSKDNVRNFLSDAAIKMGMPEYEAKPYEFNDHLMKQFLSDAHLPEPHIDEQQVHINLFNGTFEFKNANCHLRNFDPNDFLCYQLPFPYDKGATSPLFNNYLLKVLPDEESRKVMQEFIGFIFTRMNLEKCLVLLGSGGNGKSVFFNIINALIGKENILNYSLGLFREEYNRAKLTNVLLNYSSEKGFDLHPDIFKALISGEPLQAREPYGRSFTIHNPVKFIINCNELPKETETTEAFFRRFLIIQFDVKISEEEKDINIANKIIRNELPGVFNWALEGLQRLMLQQEFTKCEKAEIVLREFRKQADSVQLFIEENNYISSESFKESLTNLYRSYKEFCKEDNYKPLGKVRFSKRLEGKGFQKIRMNDGFWFCIEKKVS